jgi:hypothetical protein
MPLPFTRELSVQTPVLRGKDVLILQQLLNRNSAEQLAVDSAFGVTTASAVQAFQKSHGLPADRVVGAATAASVMSQCGSDGYRDINGSAAAAYLQQYAVPHKYKVVVPVHRNRSIETTASLYNGQGALLLTFTARAHGKRDGSNDSHPWPDFGDNDHGRTQFASNGNTPTGAIAFDLNR